MDGLKESQLIRIEPIAQLLNYGIKADHVTFPRVTMSSNRWLCCRHSDKKKKDVERVTALNLTRKTPRALTWPITADSAMMNPRKPWLALKVESYFQVFNVVAQKQIHSCSLSDDIIFWSWINENIIGMVTDRAVYHWDVSGSGSVPPALVFLRNKKLSFSQVVSYKTDRTAQWFILVGLTRAIETGDSNAIRGYVQVYSNTYRCSQLIEAQAANFSSYKFSGNVVPSTVLCLVNRPTGCCYGKIHIMELGPHLAGNASLRNLTEPINFSKGGKYDIPIAVEVCCSTGLVYVMTKAGFVKVCDVESAMHLCTARASESTVFISVPHSDKGILGVSRNSKVFHMTVKEKELLHHIRSTLRRPAIATRLEKSFSGQS
ncbi:clathrin heavy chain 2-like [Anneissia japonica]|uniref:clathrin heavy chain 2-like n=1 Tax=Anneissia japonica TaxID=1529436 RepID=UPI0014257C9A|nr:clathrin heavy chain 2-like [Anneissia japonica]